MTFGLRISLIVVSFLTLLYMARKVRRSQIRLEDSLFWFCFAVLLFLVSIFPGIFYVLSALIGTMSVANFVFLFFIFVLLISCFAQSVRISQLDTKLRDLTQQLAIERFERYANDRVAHARGAQQPSDAATETPHDGD